MLLECEQLAPHIERDRQRMTEVEQWLSEQGGSRVVRKILLTANGIAAVKVSNDAPRFVLDQKP